MPRLKGAERLAQIARRARALVAFRRAEAASLADGDSANLAERHGMEAANAVFREAGQRPGRGGVALQLQRAVEDLGEVDAVEEVASQPSEALMRRITYHLERVYTITAALTRHTNGPPHGMTGHPTRVRGPEERET